MKRIGICALVATIGCTDASEPPSIIDTDEPLVVTLADVVDSDGEGSVTLLIDVAAAREVVVDVGGEQRIVELSIALDDGMAAAIDNAPIERWWAPRPTDDFTVEIEGGGVAELTVWARGAPLPAARRDRSLVWTDGELLDDLSVAGLGRLMSAASDDGHGGVMFDRWFRRFATTAHSERAGPAQLVDEHGALIGTDPSLWDLDALPFRVTAVHNRLDLAPRAAGCGELRVSLSSTHPIYAPLHLIFLFNQPPEPADIAPDGTPDGRVHCLATARRWTRLSALDGAAFRERARALLASGLTHDNFLLAESVELTVSPWEWRQWIPTASGDLDNPPLFQTVNTPALNQPGALRDAFLTFVQDNAAALAARDILIPESFRARSAHAPPSIEREQLDLAGIDPVIAADYPDLARSIEIVGCPACHTEHADFVQTHHDRSFSEFYDKELDARRDWLDGLNVTATFSVPPFGPLQE